MQLLVYFCENPERVISHAELIEAVWGRTELSPNSLSVAIGAIRQALGDDARQPRFIETHKKLGYRLLLSPQRLEATLAPVRHTKKWLIWGAVGLIAVTVALWTWIDGATDSSFRNALITLQPIENDTGSDAYDDVAVILGDVMIAELAQTEAITVRREIPPSLLRALPTATPGDSAAASITGHLIRQESDLVLSIYLEDTHSSRILWGDKKIIREDQLLAGAMSIAKDIVDSLNIDNGAGTADQGNQDRAGDLYRLARQLASVVSDSTIKLAHDLLLETIRIDASYGTAHGLLAELYSWHYPTSFWGLQGDRFDLAERELALARELGADEAYILVTQAGIHLARDRRYDLSKRLLARAAILRPDDPWILRPQIWTNMMFGEFDLALKNNSRAAALSLDPRSVLAERVAPLYYTGRFQESLDLYVAAVGLGLKPLYQGPHAAIMLGDQAAAFNYWVDFVRQQGVDIEDETRARQWVASGDLRAGYNWLRERAGSFLLERNFALASPSWHIAAGDNDLAMAEIDAAIRVYRSEREPEGMPDYSWTLFFYDPLFAEVRNDPRMSDALSLLRFDSIRNSQLDATP